MTSVNTNVGALVALSNLNRTNFDLTKTQNRISTGYKVVGAQDDGSIFAIAQGLRADIKSFDAVQQSLSSGTGILSAAIAGANSVSNLLGDIKKKAIEASNPANTANQQSVLSADFNQMLAQLNTFVTNSIYNGRNLLSTGATNVAITATLRWSADDQRCFDPVPGVGAAERWRWYDGRGAGAPEYDRCAASGGRNGAGHVGLE
jgi:flagellin